MRIALGGMDLDGLRARAATFGSAVRSFSARLAGRQPSPAKRPSLPGWLSPAQLARHAGAFRAGFADGSLGLTVILRACGGFFRRAGGETKAGLIFLAALMVLTILPKPDPYAMPVAGLREEIAATLEAPGPQDAPYARAPWRHVRPSMAAYALDAPELGREAPIYRIRATAEGARQDLLVFAPKDTRSLSGAIAIEQMPEGQRLPAHRLGDTLFVETARRAALLGASIERMAQPTGLETKFGDFEVADSQIIQQGQLRSCLAFRLVADAPVDIAGLLCGEPQRPADRASLACVLDRLDLVSAGNDVALRRYFAGAERARLHCGKAAPGRGLGLKQVIFDGARIRG